jgi:hypothetical protein
MSYTTMDEINAARLKPETKKDHQLTRTADRGLFKMSSAVTRLICRKQRREKRRWRFMQQWAG